MKSKTDPESLSLSLPLILREKFYVKSLRFDRACFVDEFIEGITRTSLQSKPRSPRYGVHKRWTANGFGIFERLVNKKSPYPAEELHKKPWLSSHQSVSLVLKDRQIPVFGFDKVRATSLVGVILDPE